MAKRFNRQNGAQRNENRKNQKSSRNSGHSEYSGRNDRIERSADGVRKQRASRATQKTTQQGTQQASLSAAQSSLKQTPQQGYATQQNSESRNQQSPSQQSSSQRNRTAQHEQPAQQYFAAEPTSADIRRTLSVTLRGHEANVEVSNGVFSGSRVDLGTSVFLKHAPETPENGTFLDLGCGWGPIALAMAFDSPQANVWAVDVNERAVELTNINAQRNNCKQLHAVTPEQLPEELTYDLIWSNPPIRVGKEVLHTLLMTYLPRLKPAGAAYLVVQKNLGSDSLIPWLAQALGNDYEVSKYGSSKGFRVIEVLRTE